MVARDVVLRKVTRARGHLAEAEPIFARELDVFLADRKERDLAMFYLFLAIQECLDLASHWIVDDDLPAADSYAESFRVLAERGRIDESLATSMAQAAGLRNLIVHGYASIEPERVREEARAGIATLRRFLAAVAQA